MGTDPNAHFGANANDSADFAGTISPHAHAGDGSSAGSMHAGHPSGISETWHRIAVFATVEQFNKFINEHPEGLRSGKDSKVQSGCVLLASSATIVCHH